MTPATSAERQRGGSTGALRGRMPLVVTAVVALLVGGVAGAAVGWKVEQDRVKSDLANIRPVGTVTAVTADSLSVKLSSASGKRVFTLSDSTVIDRAATGAPTDLVKGATVLLRVRQGDGSNLEAVEVVVLPDATTWGKKK